MRDEFMQAAIDEAKQGLAEGGIPIGSVIVHKGKIIGRGHNMRVQLGSAIHHVRPLPYSLPMVIAHLFGIHSHQTPL